MNNQQPDSDTQKISQFLECIITNFIGLYLNSYLGVALSVILLLWHWQNEMGCDRPQKSLLISLAVIVLLILTHPSYDSKTAIAPPLVGIQRMNCPCPLQSIKNRVSPRGK